MQYLSLLIPLIAIMVGLIWFRKELVWWEYLAVFFTPFLFVVISTLVIKNSIPESMTTKNWHSTEVEYTEHWNEYIHKTCSEEYACGTTTVYLAKGQTQTQTKYCTRHYDCSYVDDHPARWEMSYSGGQSMSISPSEFEAKCALWGTKKFVEMNRRFHSIDGDRFSCAWDNKPEHVVTYTEPTRYENRLLVTKNIFGFRKVDSLEVARYGLPKEPSDDFAATTNFQFTTGVDINQKAYRELYETNGIFGSTKKMTLQMVTFRDKPSDVCDVLESYWYGGKKNEVTLCVNLRGKEVGNVKVISWAKDNLFKIQIRDSVAGMKEFDSYVAAKALSGLAMKAYQLRDFKEFDYIELEVELKTWHYILIWVMVTLISFIILFAVVKNDIRLKKDWLK